MVGYIRGGLNVIRPGVEELVYLFIYLTVPEFAESVKSLHKEFKYISLNAVAFASAYPMVESPQWRYFVCT
jgi:hypothetical protein